MPDIVGLESTNLTTPQSPASISTQSSRRGSLTPILISARESWQSRVSSPPGCLTRKRAPTLNTERSSLSQGVGDLVIHEPSTIVPAASDLTREQVCLCQPDPKIPRPRNGIQQALYRFLTCFVITTSPSFPVPFLHTELNLIQDK